MSQSHTVTLELDDEDLKLIYRALSLAESKSNEAITRATRFPSETVASRETKRKHREILEHIDFLRNHIAENSQW
jgi:hypothetical protein